MLPPRESRAVSEEGLAVVYDRHFLLGGARRNEVLELGEVRRYGLDSYGDAEYVSMYGLRPGEWYALGVRVLGRTAVECTRDGLGKAIGMDVAAVVRGARHGGGVLVLDLFAGSGNTLYWILRHLPGARGLGFELDPKVFELTTRNLAAIGTPIEIVNTDYRTGIADTTASTEELVVAFIAPPWGDALSATTGLDLRRTAPPVGEIVEVLSARFGQNRLLCAVQVYERVAPVSLERLQHGFDWSTLRMYDLNVPGQNHGILPGTRGWKPWPAQWSS
jgi:hypothetical protein